MCSINPRKGGSRCRITNVVYTVTCQICKKAGGTIGTYIGESSRCLNERSKEHLELLDRADPSSFIIKHWAERQPLTVSDSSMPELASSEESSSDEDDNSKAFALRPWYAPEE